MFFKPITDFLSVAVVATEAVSSSKSNKPPSKLIFFGGFGFSASLSFGCQKGLNFNFGKIFYSTVRVHVVCLNTSNVYLLKLYFV